MFRRRRRCRIRHLRKNPNPLSRRPSASQSVTRRRHRRYYYFENSIVDYQQCRGAPDFFLFTLNH